MTASPFEAVHIMRANSYQGKKKKKNLAAVRLTPKRKRDKKIGAN